VSDRARPSRENTAVDSRNGTSTTIRLMNAVDLERRRSFVAGVGLAWLVRSPDLLRGGSGPMFQGKLILGRLQAVDDLTGGRRAHQERMDQQGTGSPTASANAVLFIAIGDAGRQHLGLFRRIDLRHRP